MLEPTVTFYAKKLVQSITKKYCGVLFSNRLGRITGLLLNLKDVQAQITAIVVKEL